MIEVKVSFRAESLTVAVDDDATVADLKAKLSEMTHVPEDKQKLMGRSLKINSPAETRIRDIKEPRQFTLIGSTAEQIDGVNAQVERRIQRNIAQAKAASRSKQPSPQYTFQSLETLSGFSHQDKALSILQQLKADPGIIYIMNKNKWNIALLSEMSPITQPTLLGYNMNKGQKIALRLRTDDMEGFRYFTDIRRVLVHELTHMVYGEHDSNFWKLCRELELEVNKQQGRSLYEGPHFRGASKESESEWDRIDRGGYQGGTFILGGPSSSQSASRPMREVLAEAAELRLIVREP